MKILTTHWPKPLPTNKYDWTAWVDGKEEWYVGYGSTEDEAINDLNANVGDIFDHHLLEAEYDTTDL